MDTYPNLDPEPAVLDTAGLRAVQAAALLDVADEREAVDARARYRTEGPPRLEPDVFVADRLEGDEAVVDVRHEAVLHRHPVGDEDPAVPGRLYLTTRRLILLGEQPVELDLETIEEVALSGGRLLVTLRDGTGATIEASGPRLLRVHIAAALAAARA